MSLVVSGSKSFISKSYETFHNAIMPFARIFVSVSISPLHHTVTPKFHTLYRAVHHLQNTPCIVFAFVYCNVL